MQAPEPAKKKLAWWQIAHTVAAATFGVQSTKNLDRDLAHGSPRVFIIAGIVGTLLFVLAVAFVVGLVLRASGG
jgi:hypothetical protein